MISLWIAQASAAAESAGPVDGQGWLIDPELVDPGYGQTVAGGEIQTGFPPPPPQPETPEWLKSLFNAIGDFFQWSAPAVKPILWVGAALLLLFILYHFVPAFAEWVDRLRFGRRRAAAEENQVGQAEAGAARALLAEADALAAEGRFAEAIHLLLYRSVEDIEGRRPGLVRPAMTSRELAEAHDLPGVARDAFSRIARAVEISLFGGRSIDAGAWDQCRSAYAELTVPRNWART
ncbi:DUF4129 domain-containing protein [Sphingopyxis macrogoltabida]|uniref:Protein-glutamine gamma-glutamyltransferase-like C-terminal domain-containing protein n=1 Tax=Sphingopyxis macrogoltabida TaxID=33050 RepID=A0AAC9FH98_SPHMC|nr:DUF4129 domain-containing protein [Sphingopyxis macrogoltabida]ALJ16143.1 hypothetical protein LH19_24965 [Sphingopyxis macrogoltabida]AMU92383.1 hypothetical protein ATM17_25535 [Sphingopyxis macrogoltabida]